MCEILSKINFTIKDDNTMGKSNKWHNNGHIGHIENLIDDSLLEIEWILKENFYVKDPTSLK